MTTRNDAFVDFIGICYRKVPSLLMNNPAASCGVSTREPQFVTWRATGNRTRRDSTKNSTTIAELAQWMFHKVANALTHCFEEWLAAPV